MVHGSNWSEQWGGPSQEQFWVGSYFPELLLIIGMAGYA